MDLAYNEITKEISLEFLSLQEIDVNAVASFHSWQSDDVGVIKVDDSRLSEIRSYTSGSVSIREVKDKVTGDVLSRKVLPDFTRQFTESENLQSVMDGLTPSQKTALKWMVNNNLNILRFMREFEMLPKQIEEVASLLP